MRTRRHGAPEEALGMEPEPVTTAICQGHLCKVRWKKNDGEPLHTCPYRVGVLQDEVKLCNCCDACRQNCADDV